MKTIRKFVLFVIVLIFVFDVTAGGEPGIAQATTKAEENAAKKAFKKFLSQSKIKWAKSNSSYSASDYSFCYMTLGKSKTPILILSCYQSDHSSGYVAIYMYVHGKVKCMEVHDNILAIYKKNGIIAMGYGNGNMNPTWYYKVSGTGTIKELAFSEILPSGLEEIRYRADTYRFNRKSVTKEKFKKLLKKQTGTTKLPSRKSGNAVKLFKNTNQNRKKYFG